MCVCVCVSVTLLRFERLTFRVRAFVQREDFSSFFLLGITSIRELVRGMGEGGGRVGGGVLWVEASVEIAQSACLPPLRADHKAAGRPGQCVLQAGRAGFYLPVQSVHTLTMLS